MKGSEPTTDYVVVQSVSVAQRRWGLEAVRTLTEEFLPLIEFEATPAEVLMSAIGVLLTAGRRRLSLVDCVSFIRMRDLSTRDYVGADPHFDEHSPLPALGLTPTRRGGPRLRPLRAGC